VADNPFHPDQPIQLQGQLLLADPSLRDGIFDRSVILLTEHQLAVHTGGPVALDQLTFSSFWWSKKLGLRWAMRISAAQAMAHAHRPGRVVRAFVGYSGWTAGQLENELRRNSWTAARPQSDLLGRVHDRGLWADLLRQLSPLHRILAEAPDDPTLN